MKLGHFHTATLRVRAACLSFWLLFLWLYPVALSATNTAEEGGHACCRRTKHSCCKKAGKGASMSSRSCGTSCPALGKFQTGPVSGLPAQSEERADRPTEPTTRVWQSLPAPVTAFTPTQFQRPPPAA
ncbi:MAG: hypothetical protein JST93_28230 [Acidobacteria bacterium]|nr:hypothetical protein [Acidobacteriota bacterium]